ncbi:unnamed protein product [Paramecium sonneborni]|uniref:Uncharacterized protein n=1 Tax=Paramecium sonneborni TaxID=65129 RepID=A0A8S1P2K8_9CILI|nr:unnamed protein product [Paramecium sonneborni]
MKQTQMKKQFTNIIDNIYKVQYHLLHQINIKRITVLNHRRKQIFCLLKIFFKIFQKLFFKTFYQQLLRKQNHKTFLNSYLRVRKTNANLLNFYITWIYKIEKFLLQNCFKNSQEVIQNNFQELKKDEQFQIIIIQIEVEKIYQLTFDLAQKSEAIIPLPQV